MSSSPLSTCSSSNACECSTGGGEGCRVGLIFGTVDDDDDADDDDGDDEEEDDDDELE